MKMSLRLMILMESVTTFFAPEVISYILMTEVFEEFQFTVCSLRQNRRTEGFHDFLDGNSLAGELIFCRASYGIQYVAGCAAKGAVVYHTNPNAPMPTGCKSVYLFPCQYLEAGTVGR